MKEDILVIDDTRDNLRLLSRILSEQGYQVRPAHLGTRALAAAKAQPPDLIMLDIMMPQMDGYAVCEALKADKRTHDIPVIFISALNEVFDKVKAFSIGGVDYITKPFQEKEVIARVETHLELKRARDEIAAQKLRLEEQNQELTEAALLREDVERITQHDLKTPLNPVIGFTQLIMKNEHLTAKEREYLKIIEAAGHQMLQMINSSLDLLKIERGNYPLQPAPVDILKVLKRIEDELYRPDQTRKAMLEVFLNGRRICDNDRFFVLGEELLCYSMLGNLIKNALEASSEGERVTVTFDESEEAIIRIHNNGVVPENIRDRFFDKYITSGKGIQGTGLGTYSAKLMAETQQGVIDMISSKKEGTTITIRLPTSTFGTFQDEKINYRHEESEPMVTPPLDVLIELHELAATNDILAIEEYARKIEHREQKYSPFVSTILQLTNTFQFNLICDFVQGFIEEAEK